MDVLTKRDVEAYFLALVERSPAVEPWSSWFARNEQQLRLLISPAELAEIKSTGTAGIYDLLETWGHRYPRRRPIPALSQPDPVPSSWLRERVFPGTVEQDIAGSQALQDDWELVRSRMQPNDEVWTYSGPLGSGYAIVRGGVVIDALTMIVI